MRDRARGGAPTARDEQPFGFGCDAGAMGPQTDEPGDVELIAVHPGTVKADSRRSASTSDIAEGECECRVRVDALASVPDL